MPTMTFVVTKNCFLDQPPPAGQDPHPDHGMCCRHRLHSYCSHQTKFCSIVVVQFLHYTLFLLLTAVYRILILLKM